MSDLGSSAGGRPLDLTPRGWGGVGGGHYSLRHSNQTGSWTHTKPTIQQAPEVLSQVQNGREVRLTTPLHLLPKIKPAALT